MHVYDDRMTSNVAGALIALRQKRPKSKVVDRMFDACGPDAEQVKESLLSGEFSPEVMVRALKDAEVSVVASASQVRRWIEENS